MSRRGKAPHHQRHVKDCRLFGKKCTKAKCWCGTCDCKWSFRVKLPDGTEPRVTSATREESEVAYHDLMSTRPDALPDKTTTIAQWAERWLTVGRDPRGRKWAPATERSYRSVVPNHVLPYFGDWKVTEVKYDDVLRWFEWGAERGSGETSIFHAYTCLKGMYRLWEESSRPLPTGNPCHRGMLAKPEVERFDQLTDAEHDGIIGAARRLRPELVMVMRWESVYAMRASETLGLRAEDIAFTGKDENALLGPQLARLAALPADEYKARKPRLNISKQLDRYTRQRARTKAGKVRSLFLPQVLAAELAAQLAGFPEADGWLFTNSLGSWGHRAAHPKPWRYEAYWTWFRRCAEAAGVTLPPRHATHMLKHYRVATLRDEGHDDRKIADWTGNSVQVLARYGNRRPTEMADLADEIAAPAPERRLRVVGD